MSSLAFPSLSMSLSMSLSTSLSTSLSLLPDAVADAARHLNLDAFGAERRPRPVPATGRPLPRLALVLGSGGVKSSAGLGVARVLEQAGAVFGALVALGRGVDHAQRIATTLWSPEITGRPRRRGWLELGAPRMAGFDEHFALRDDGAILERMHSAFGDRHLEELAIPMSVVATCARSGERVVLTEGRVVDALRATVALPMLFAPWPVQGRLLMDGSVCDPLPLDAAIHAQRTLAVGFECPMPKRIDRPGRMVARIASALTNNVLHARIAAADPARCHVMLLEPEKRVGLFDTERMPELVALGEMKARQWLESGAPAGGQVPTIQPLALPLPAIPLAA
jgi:NTE family protein